MNLKSLIVAVALVATSMSSVFSQGLVVANSGIFNSAQTASSLIWSAAQSGAGSSSQVYLGSWNNGSLNGSSVTNGSWSDLVLWNVSLSYSAGILYNSMTNTANGNVVQTSLAVPGAGSVASLVFQIEHYTGVTIQDMLLNGAAVSGGQNISYSGSFLNSRSYLQLSVDSGNFNSAQFNLITGANNPGQNFEIDTFMLAPATVPEPGTMVLAVIGGASLLLYRRKK